MRQRLPGKREKDMESKRQMNDKGCETMYSYLNVNLFLNDFKNEDVKSFLYTHPTWKKERRQQRKKKKKTKTFSITIIIIIMITLDGNG